MNRADLINDIKGSILKKHYLEAFLAQSAYIEGLLKMAADFQIFSSVNEKISYDDRVIKYFKNVVGQYSLNDLIDFLHTVEAINDDLKSKLHNYRKKRNRILHDLIKELQKEEFETELLSTCKLGEEIIDSNLMVMMAEGVDMFEIGVQRLKAKMAETESEAQKAKAETSTQENS